MVMKTCSKCKIQKPLSEFSKDRYKKDGLCSSCKDCIKKHNQANKENIREYKKKYYQANREKYLDEAKKNYQENKESKLEYRKKYYQENKDYCAQRQKKYYQENKKWINELNRKYQKCRSESDPLFKLTKNLRVRTCSAFRKLGYSKKSKTKETLGAEWLVVKYHIESRFKEGMTWDNYGEWQVDHIIPLASARTEEELIELCHYTNLQPLWADENRSKKDNIIACRLKYIK